MRSLRGALRDHFDAPRNVGRLDARGAGVGCGIARNAACGDELHLWVCVEAERVVAARFQAQACSAVIACSSLVACRLEGLSMESARTLDVSALARAAGGVPPGKSHAPGIVARALQEALDVATAKAPTAPGAKGPAASTDRGGDDPCSAS